MDDLELWKIYKKSGDRAALGELVRRLEPSIDTWLSTHVGRHNLPPTAVKSHAITKTVDAIGRWDPKGGASLRTWVVNNLMGVYRLVEQHRAVARIPEAFSTKAHMYHSALKELKLLRGRSPSNLELSEHLGLSMKDVDRLSRDVGAESVTAGYEGWEPILRPAESTIVDYVYMFDLTPEERVVFERLSGYNSATRKFDPKSKKEGNEVARMLGKSAATVSQIKKGVVEKLKRRMVGSTSLGED